MKIGDIEINSAKSFYFPFSLNCKLHKKIAYHTYLYSLFIHTPLFSIFPSDDLELYDKNGELILHILSPDLDVDKERVTEEFTAYMNSLDKSFFQQGNGKSNKRFTGDYTACHLGYHIHNPRTNEYNTNRTVGKTYLIQYSQLGNRKLQDLEFLLKFISKHFASHHPKQFQQLLENTHQYFPNNSFGYTTAALNIDECESEIHDDDDYGISTLFYGGNFSKRCLVFPQLNVKLHVQPGSIVWFCGKLLHYVEKSRKNRPNDEQRYSGSFYSKTFSANNIIVE